MCLGAELLAGAVFPQQKCYEPANVFGSAFRASALKLKRITDNVLTYCSTEYRTNVMHKPALSTIHQGLDFQTLSISIDRSTLVLESLQSSNPGGLGRLAGSGVKGPMVPTSGPTRELTNLESWRLGEVGWLGG